MKFHWSDTQTPYANAILDPMNTPSKNRQYRAVLGWLAMLMSIATSGFAQTGADEFAACTARFKEEAASAGISAAVANDVLDNVQWVSRVIELDRVPGELRVCTMKPAVFQFCNP